MTTEQRLRKTKWQRDKRRAAAVEAGRVPGTTGRPATGRVDTTRRRGNVPAQRARARERRDGTNGTMVTDHAIMDAAAAACVGHIKPDRRTHYNDMLYEECLMEAALAILVGADPEGAVVATLRSERSRGYHQAPLLDHGGL